MPQFTFVVTNLASDQQLLRTPRLTIQEVVELAEKHSLDPEQEIGVFIEAVDVEG